MDINNKVIILSLCSVVSSQAAVTVDFTEEVGGVRVVVSGRLDTNGYTHGGPDGYGTLSGPGQDSTIPANFAISEPTQTLILNEAVPLDNQVFTFSNSATPTIGIFQTSFSPGMFVQPIPELYFSDGFGMRIDRRYFESEQFITQLLPLQTFASLGLVDGVISRVDWFWTEVTITGKDPGDFTEEQFSDSIAVRVGSAVSVPESGSALLSVFGISILAIGRKRSK